MIIPLRDHNNDNNRRAPGDKSNIMQSSLSYAASGSVSHHVGNTSCNPSTFSFPHILGAELVNVAANEVRNYTTSSLLPSTDVPVKGAIDFCNVTVTYGHTGWNDSINVSLWFPLAAEDWNGRLLGVGGGGYAASLGSIYQTAAVDKGYVAIATDSGHASGQAAATNPNPWVTVSPGNFNYPLIEDFASRTLGELSVIAKHAAKDYYGVRPAFSYFTGCSGGGRQGLELAQSFPDAFDGILAAAPATYFETILVAGYWPTLLMNQLDVFPPSCEIKAFTAAAVEQCDGSDGLQDGIISHLADCDFDARGMVGRNFTYDGEQRAFTQAGASIVEAAWHGFNASGISWPGVEIGADLTESLIVTDCGDSPRCALGDLWSGMLANFVAADPNFDPSNLSTEAFAEFLARSIALWRPSLGSANPHLQPFQQAGGKLIMWHGTADTTIPPKGSTQYYEQVLQHNTNVSDFFRHFEAPGVGHCSGGPGPLPNAALEQLVSWVENGIAPATLDASSAATGLRRPLCPYPSRQVFVGGEANSSASFACA
jgi:hypothetical protein